MTLEDIIKNCNRIVLFYDVNSYQNSICLLDYIRYIKSNEEFDILYDTDIIESDPIKPYVCLLRSLRNKNYYNKSVMYYSDLIMQIDKKGEISFIKNRYTEPSEVFNLEYINYFQRKSKIKKILKKIKQ